MIPPIEHVVHKRHDKRRQCRMLALVFTICAAIICGWIVLWTAFSQQNYLSSSLFENPMFWLGSAFMIPVIPLVLFAGILSRWLVPMPSPRCPGCGHGVLPGSRTTCPECGVELPEALTRGAAPLGASGG